MAVEREHRSTNLSPGNKSKKDEEESKFQTILANFHALTKESRRDYWLRKLLQSVGYVCNSSGSSQSSVQKLVTAVERTSNKAYSTDISKYNANMRSLNFCLKKNALLALPFFKGELMPSVILNMSPTELKVGKTAEEIEKDQPKDSITIQMTDSRCRSCTKKNVSVANVIRAGHTDRYEFMNKVLYAREGAKSIMYRTFEDFPWDSSSRG